jgi:hypothetical protein
MADETVYLTRKEMLQVRDLADKRMLPTSLYRGQRIIGYSEWKTGDLSTPSIWRAVVVLVDGTRLEIVEERGR